MMKNSSYFILKVKATKQRQIVSDLFLFLKILYEVKASGLQLSFNTF